MMEDKFGKRRDRYKTCRACGEEKPSQNFRKTPGDLCVKCLWAAKREELMPTMHQVKDLRKPTTASLLARLEDLCERLLASINNEEINDSKLRDKMVAFGIAAEKRSLLRGEPTHRIATYKEIHEREALLMACVAELRARGKTIDITPKEEHSSTTDNATPQGAVEQNGTGT